MARKTFFDIPDLLADFADRVESGQVRISYDLNFGVFPSARIAEAFEKEALRLCGTGLLSPKYEGKGFNRRLAKLALADVDGLFVFLGRTRLKAVVAPLVSVLTAKSEAWEAEVIGNIASTWASNGKWRSLSVSDIELLLSIQIVARALRKESSDQIDQRTLCSRLVGDSKFLENRWQQVYDYIFYSERGPDRSFRGLLNHFGVPKVGEPVLLSGPFSISDMKIGPWVAYLGVAETDIHKVGLTSLPAYVLSIENRTSFHRHATETNATKEGIVLYSGGQPSFNMQQLYKHIVDIVPISVPIFHWSDIDEGGLDIFSTMEALCPRVQPHLMSVSLAIEFGLPVSGKPSVLTKGGTKLDDVARHLSQTETKTLEQEVLDPQRPLAFKSETSIRPFRLSA